MSSANSRGDVADRGDADFMRLALEEARRGRTSPNPRVGAVIVQGGEVVATGYHLAAGEAHAEVAALQSAPGSVEGATLYVTLEPCNHQGRTGPCTEAILSAGIARVVIGCRDPAEHGLRGAERLQQAGVEVVVGVEEVRASALVADFAKHSASGLPWVTLKAAVTLDGKIASRTGESKWITGQEARTATHRMRDEADAILVGIGTVLADDPRLTVRHVEGRDPIRVVLDADLRTPDQANVLNSDGESSAPTWVFHAEDVDPARRHALERSGVELIGVARTAVGLDLREVLIALGSRDVMRLMVEGGARIHGSFLEQRLADDVAIFVAPRILGDAEAIPFAAGRTVGSIKGASTLADTRVAEIGGDWLITGNFEREA